MDFPWFFMFFFDKTIKNWHGQKPGKIRILYVFLYGYPRPLYGNPRPLYAYGFLHVQNTCFARSLHVFSCTGEMVQYWPKNMINILKIGENIEYSCIKLRYPSNSPQNLPGHSWYAMFPRHSIHDCKKPIASARHHPFQLSWHIKALEISYANELFLHLGFQNTSKAVSQPKHWN